MLLTIMMTAITGTKDSGGQLSFEFSWSMLKLWALNRLQIVLYYYYMNFSC